MAYLLGTLVGATLLVFLLSEIFAGTLFKNREPGARAGLSTLLGWLIPIAIYAAFNGFGDRTIESWIAYTIGAGIAFAYRFNVYSKNWVED